MKILAEIYDFFIPFLSLYIQNNFGKVVIVFLFIVFFHFLDTIAHLTLTSSIDQTLFVLLK